MKPAAKLCKGFEILVLVVDVVEHQIMDVHVLSRNLAVAGKLAVEMLERVGANTRHQRIAQFLPGSMKRHGKSRWHAVFRKGTDAARNAACRHH